jgi:hypothetical protein
MIHVTLLIQSHSYFTEGWIAPEYQICPTRARYIKILAMSRRIRIFVTFLDEKPLGARQEA